ncbi:hypothetical protein AVEN_40384-1, partial [Araneus ventricosus]
VQRAKEVLHSLLYPPLHTRRLGWERLDHSAYSPDLALSDFHLFPALKSALSERYFRSSEEE